MPFEEVAERVSARFEPPPCTMRLKIRARGKPACVVTLRKKLMEELGWKKSTNVSLALGTGEDAGKARITLSASGPFRLKILKFSGQIDLGYVAAFGDVPKVSVAAPATKLNGTAIELKLPDWSAVEDDVAAPEDDAEDDGAATVPATRPPAPPAQRAVQAPAAPRREPEPAARNGVRVTFGAKPAIYHDDRSLALTERQAIVLAILTRALGNIMLTADIIQRADLPASNGATMISDVFVAVEQPLEKIGLKMRFVPKMGYSLAKDE